MKWLFAIVSLYALLLIVHAVAPPDRYDYVVPTKEQQRATCTEKANKLRHPGYSDAESALLIKIYCEPTQR
jgi:hypothetical protein